MFTGLIRERGELAERGGMRMRIACPELRAGLRQGDSIAVNGVCLTAEALTLDGFTASLLPETLAATTLGRIEPGSRLNLETAARIGDTIGGHWIQGHVDGTARVLTVQRVEGQGPGEFSYRVGLELPGWLVPWIVPKGSIALDGVSLTVQSIGAAGFDVALIPETCRATTLGNIMAGDLVNVEADLLVKVASRTVEALLARQGFAAPKERQDEA